MKITLDKGYQQLWSWNPFCCNYVYIDVQMRALAEDSDEAWFYTDADFVHAKLPVMFDDKHTYIASEEYEVGNRFVIVNCAVYKNRKHDFVRVMEERHRRLRDMCGKVYVDLVENLNKKTHAVNKNRKEVEGGAG